MCECGATCLSPFDTLGERGSPAPAHGIREALTDEARGALMNSMVNRRATRRPGAVQPSRKNGHGGLCDLWRAPQNSVTSET